VASLLADRLSWPRAAYGDLIRPIATSRGLTHDRATLQIIGTELIATGWDALTCHVLGQAAWGRIRPARRPLYCRLGPASVRHRAIRDRQPHHRPSPDRGP